MSKPGWHYQDESNIIRRSNEAPASEGFHYRQYEDASELLDKKSTWEIIPAKPTYIAWHIRGNTAFICNQIEARLGKRGLNLEENASCWYHEMPTLWIKYERAPVE